MSLRWKGGTMLPAQFNHDNYTVSCSTCSRSFLVSTTGMKVTKKTEMLKGNYGRSV